MTGESLLVLAGAVVHDLEGAAQSLPHVLGTSEFGEIASPARDEVVQQQRIAGSVVDRFFDGHDAQMVRSPTELLAQSKQEGCA